MDKLDMNFEWLWDSGDATSTYNVIPSRPCTVREVVDWLLEHSKKHNEWGDVDIHGPDKYYPMSRILEYNRGKIVPDEKIYTSWYDPNGLKMSENCRVVKITANGGWSLMTYEVFVEDFPCFEIIHPGHYEAGRKEWNSKQKCGERSHNVHS